MQAMFSKGFPFYWFNVGFQTNHNINQLSNQLYCYQAKYMCLQTCTHLHIKYIKCIYFIPVEITVKSYFNKIKIR